MTRPDPSDFHCHEMPDHLQTVVQPFADLAGSLASSLPCNSDSNQALEKLLEARQLALRAMRHQEDQTSGTQPEFDFGETAGPAFESTHHRSLEGG